MTAQTLKHSRIVQHSPIFYGWIVWCVATVGLVATMPGQSFSISLFIDHYIVEFGLDRTTVSGLFGLGTFVAALSLTWVGRQIDRQGNRRTSIVIALLFALALMACSLITGPITIFISFVAVRGLGQGAMGLVNTTAVAQWFQRRRGLMIALSLVMFGLFQRFYLPWMQSFIETNGWRAAWILMGAMMALGVLPLLGVFLRDRPESFGLLPDGKVENADKRTILIEENWTLSEALHTTMFWVFAFARMLVGAWATALIFHQISVFEQLGYSARVAADTFGQVGVIAAVFTLISGWLVTRLRPSYLIAIQMIALIVGMGIVPVMLNPALLPVYVITFSIFLGLGAVFDGAVWVDLFGREHQGAIRGFVTTTSVIGTALGPIIFGLSFDQFGSYTPALWLGIILSAIALILSLIVKKPAKRVQV